MPQEVDTCRHSQVGYDVRTPDIWALCKLGHSANHGCITSGRPECEYYERGTVLTPEDMAGAIFKKSP